MHRKHSLVNQLTRFTAGTACLWCHTEHHSTDRLKYHLRVSPACVHGLRVTTGEVYERGSGTKRSGPRAHRGLPPIRLVGPVNATPAQRAAALEGRLCSQDELDQELFAATGVSDVCQWVAACPLPAAGASSPSAVADSVVGSPDLIRPSLHCLPSPLARPIHEASRGRWFALHDCSEVRPDNWQVPSPRWEGLLRDDFACQLPSSWHRYWRCWHAALNFRPWSSEFTKTLRSASAAPSREGLGLEGLRV